MSHPRTDKHDSGVALIMVLGVLAASMLLIAHLMLITEVIAKEEMVLTTKSRLRYQAESAAEVTFWMHLTDRRLFSNRRLGQTAEDELRATKNFEPWMLDRRPHVFDNGLVLTYLSSGEEGFKVSEPASLRNNVSLDEVDLLDEINNFLDVLDDYTDSDDLRKLNGMERDEYLAEGFPTLPRNGKIEFRGEIYWLPNWRNVITGEIAIVPPPGCSFQTQATGRRRGSASPQPSFYSASPELIQRILSLSDSELEEVLEARQQWEEHGTALEDSLDIELLSKIRNAFNFTENNLAVITAAAYQQDRELRTCYRIIRETDISKASFFSDRSRQTLSIWERTVE
ncbi:MAG: hypothetical protein GX902_01380 [Lentisphaerae bacterium]|jgi:hypothetical protein|nr:hypothetical protein [Lentisphaerota bacterium]